MTRDQLVARVYTITGMSTTDQLLSASAIADLVDQANAYVGSVHDWPWQQKVVTTFVTVAGTQDYAPPADWLRTVSLRVTLPTPSDAMTMYDADEIDDTWGTTQGQPRAWAVFGDQLHIAPTPDGVYTVRHRYIVVEPALSSGSSTPLMPAQFHPAICEYASHLALRRASEEPRAAVALANFDRWIGVMQKDRLRSTSPMRVRVRAGNIV